MPTGVSGDPLLPSTSTSEVQDGEPEDKQICWWWSHLIARANYKLAEWNSRCIGVKWQNQTKLWSSHRTKDSELLGLRYFLISINLELIRKQKTKQTLEVNKEIETIIVTAEYGVPTSWVLCRVLSHTIKREPHKTDRNICRADYTSRADLGHSVSFCQV